MKIYTLNVSDRELRLLLDAVINRKEDLIDGLPFTINVLTVKGHIKELDSLIDKSRGILSEKD